METLYEPLMEKNLSGFHVPKIIKFAVNF